MRYQGVDAALIEFKDPLEMPQGYRYKSTHPLLLAQPPEVQFTLAHPNWTRMSYTMLAAKPGQKLRWITTPQTDELEHFIFFILEKGERTGNLLHHIFENIHYTQTARWTEIMQAALTRYAPRQQALYQPMLQNFIQHVLQADIQGHHQQFRLEDISFNKRLHEFEFDFPVHLFRSESLEQLSDDAIQVNVKMPGSIEGIMNGKIDLFFEHNGKYYILDWKSNYLGDSLQHYTPAALAQAMNDNNYHLQYFIYTLAVTKYLQSRLPGFDYEKHFGGVVYLFVRGVRRGGNTGIYTARPTLQKIEFLNNLLQGQPSLHLA